jgi:hypothetical protein
MPHCFLKYLAKPQSRHLKNKARARYSNPSSWEDEARQSGVQGQPGLHDETLPQKNFFVYSYHMPFELFHVGLPEALTTTSDEFGPHLISS